MRLPLPLDTTPRGPGGTPGGSAQCASPARPPIHPSVHPSIHPSVRPSRRSAGRERRSARALPGKREPRREAGRRGPRPLCPPGAGRGGSGGGRRNLHGTEAALPPQSPAGEGAAERERLSGGLSRSGSALGGGERAVPRPAGTKVWEPPRGRAGGAGGRGVRSMRGPPRPRRCP